VLSAVKLVGWPTFAVINMMNEAFLLIGGNVGQTTLYLRQALLLLDEQIGCIVAASSLYKTAAWGNTQQQDFLNIAVQLQTHLSAASLLANVLQIEQELGRQRTAMWAPRTIDIDIIFYGNSIVRQKKLTVPHPHMANRAFVLRPLADIASGILHPLLKQTVAQLLQQCSDKTHVEIYSDTGW
jgi:2-amino-4-hydroxy-6-hydroxymethyldihydropteridine diphosphokinase